jgi:hypothetical protein
VLPGFSAQLVLTLSLVMTHFGESENQPKLSVAQLTVAPDADRCFTVLREPDIIASRSAPVNCRPLGDVGEGRNA